MTKTQRNNLTKKKPKNIEKYKLLKNKTKKQSKAYTVCTGLQSQCNATTTTLFSNPSDVGLKLNVNTLKNIKIEERLKLHEWPYYKSFISDAELQKLLKEFKALSFRYDSSPYKPILFNRRTPILPVTFKGKYVKFIDDNYLKYDVLPLIYSETELVKCKFRSHPPPIEYFNTNHKQLAAKFIRQHKAQTAAEYREFLFSTVKQCNNFRPTLALQTYNFLNNTKPGNTEKPQSILDFSAGWGDRLFAACIGDKKYIGLDPNTNNTHIYDSIIKTHGKPNMQKVIATGAEYISMYDLKKHMASLDIHKFDLIFTSPPFYDYEIYSDTTQSIINYVTKNGFEKWLTFFLLHVIMRYIPILCDNGYIGIYIQDVDNNNYLEPIGLFALAFAEQFGVTVCGIISSTRYPFIVLQKIGARDIFPYKNPDTNKTFNKATVISLFRKKYPVLYQLCERLIKLDKYKLITHVITGNHSVHIQQQNIIIRAFEKVFMQLDLNIDTVILDSFHEQIPSESLKSFAKLLSHFKIKLITDIICTELQIQCKATDATSILNVGGATKEKNNNTVIVTLYPLTKYKPSALIIPFSSILTNTIDEWQLLNINNTNSHEVIKVFELLLKKYAN